MQNTVLIEQTAKNIKLAETLVLAVLFASIAAGLGGCTSRSRLESQCSSSPGSRSSASWSSASGAGGCTDEKTWLYSSYGQITNSSDKKQ